MLYYLVPILLGILIPLQSIVNAITGQRLGHPLYGTVASFTIGILLTLSILTVLKVPVQTPAKFSNIPWYFFIGGLVGCFYISSTIYIVPKIGNLAFIAMVIVTQLVASSLYDHFGFLGLIKVPLNMSKVCGLFFLLTGLALVIRK